MKKMFAFLLAAVMLASCCSAALAESVTMNGTIVAVETESVASAVGGKVEAVYVAVGDHVKAGDKLATIQTTKVYAREDGVVYVFGQAGDTVDAITARYGAVAYVEPSYTYTISASTKYTYDTEANRIVHPGENVYLRAYDDNKRTGTGVITIINGTTYTVEVHSGDFISDELILVYRDADFDAKSRIGRGNLARTALLSYTGSGSVVSYAVENGQTVQKGDLLFETVEGTFAPGEAISCDVLASSDGVVTDVKVSAGTALSAAGVVATLNPDSGMRVEASIAESDLTDIAAGDRVNVEFSYVHNGEKTATGTVERISLLAAGAANEEGEEATYNVYIKLDSTEGVHYGMNVVVVTLDQNIAELDAES